MRLVTESVSKQLFLAFLLLAAACGPLTPPRVDGGLGTGTGGSAGGAESPWVEVSLANATGTKGSVQRLAARPGEIYVLVAQRNLLRSEGGPFINVITFDSPLLNDFQLSASGAVVLTYLHYGLVCDSACENGDFEPLTVPASVIAVCGGSDRLGLMAERSDGGTALYEQGPPSTLTLDFVSVSNVSNPTACTRTTAGNMFVAGQGGVANVTSMSAVIEVPDTAALGRPSSLERWTNVSTDGTVVVASSTRGAAAIRAQDGSWTVHTALAGFIGGLALESATDIWVGGKGQGLSRFDGTRWTAAGSDPAELTYFEALAVEGSYVYVGGRDADGVARVFRRLK